MPLPLGSELISHWAATRRLSYGARRARLRVAHGLRERAADARDELRRAGRRRREPPARALALGFVAAAVAAACRRRSFSRAR